MAKQGNLCYVGRKADWVFYLYKDIPCIRSVPAVVKQTKATKACAGQFGIAVRSAKSIRDAIKSLLPDCKSRQMMNKFNTVMYKGLLNNRQNAIPNYKPFTELNGFSFNEKCALQERLKVALQIDWQQADKVTINIPALNPIRSISAPVHTITVKLQLVAVTCDLENCIALQHIAAPVIIDYVNAELPAQQLTIPISSTANGIVIVAARLHYLTTNGEVNKMEWMPAGIVEAMRIDR